MRKIVFILVSSLAFLTSCGGDETADVSAINIISANLDGATISGTFSNTSTIPSIAITFDAAVSQSDFESALSITSENGNESFELTYQNASSRVIVSLSLAFKTEYSFTIGALPIGVNGQSLKSPFNFQFTTMEDGLIRFTNPCGSASAECLQTVNLSDNDNNADFKFYANYPIYTENAEWENLTSAIIVVHGVNRNSDDYFNWMTNTIETLSMDESTILIAPSFKVSSEASANEFFWNGSEWREGADSKNTFTLSSFSIVDSLIAQLSNQDIFPVLDQIIVTGHSSGGLFTHVYSAANQSDNSSNNISYVVANTQYFYYPDKERINESNDQLFVPSNCASYDRWPLGYNSVPNYVSDVTESELNDQFINRSIYYLLGNGNQSDGSLNTSDCDATLLGSTRFSRGENMFQFMELKYPAHKHEKNIVEGIGHNGQGMYQSSEFKALLMEMLN